MVNGQLTLEPARVLHVQLGTAHGLAAGSAGGDRVDYAARAHAVLRFGEDQAAYGRYVVGGYAGSRALLGRGPRGGGLLGAKLPIVDEKFGVEGDWVIGTNEASVIGLGVFSVIERKQRWELALAAHLPSPSSGNDYAAILQLSRVARARAPAHSGLSTIRDRRATPRSHTRPRPPF